MESEFTALRLALGARLKRRTVGGIRGYEFASGLGPVFAYGSRVGRVNSAFDLAGLARKFNIKLIANLGSAGSLTPEVKPLDVVVASESAYYDVDLTAFGYRYGQMAGSPASYKAQILPFETDGSFKTHMGLILTADSFLTAATVDYNILRRFDNPLAVDMEGAAVGQVAGRLNKPYVLVRAISDEVSGSDNAEAHEELVTVCCRNAVSVLLSMLRVRLD